MKVNSTRVIFSTLIGKVHNILTKNYKYKDKSIIFLTTQWLNLIYITVAYLLSRISRIYCKIYLNPIDTSPCLLISSPLPRCSFPSAPTTCQPTPRIGTVVAAGHAGHHELIWPSRSLRLPPRCHSWVSRCVCAEGWSNVWSLNWLVLFFLTRCLMSWFCIDALRGVLPIGSFGGLSSSISICSFFLLNNTVAVFPLLQCFPFGHMQKSIASTSMYPWFLDEGEIDVYPRT